ncbi:MAG: Molybdopterin biosynthesis protein MoeA [Acidobacteriaceae bacterium]|nr:Molybdopterin biosynthesis protein MoeA [Acidobacteriaceae bacterium]
MNPSLLSYPEAAALILAAAHALPAPLRIERVSLLNAIGRVLATGVAADRDHPAFHRSTRDGYAIQAAALLSGAWIPVIGTLRAGQPAPDQPIPAGSALSIMTGAPVPQGADAVVMLEHVELRGENEDCAIRLSPQHNPAHSLRAGDNIVPVGSEAREGDVLVPSGTRIAPAHIAALAAAGAAQVDVFAQPRVSILATGDELVDIDAIPLPHQIRNSNSATLAAQVTLVGGQSERIGIARDDLNHLQGCLDQAQRWCDVLVLSGGVSAGQFDLVEQALAARGAQFHFTGVRIQPGKPAVFGELPPRAAGGAPLLFFGLPGNPVSTMVTFLLFAAPVLRALAGQTDCAPRFARATLATEEAAAGVTRFLPAHLSADWDHASVKRIAWQGSGDLAATARSNCFVVLPPNTPLEAGASVQILLP